MGVQSRPSTESGAARQEDNRQEQSRHHEHGHLESTAGVAPAQKTGQPGHPKEVEGRQTPVRHRRPRTTSPPPRRP